jgi:gluconolactonase
VKTFLSVTFLLAAPATSLASVIAPGARLGKPAGGFKFTEGPAGDAKGNLFFTDQPNDRILEWRVDGQLSTFLQPVRAGILVGRRCRAAPIFGLRSTAALP